MSSGTKRPPQNEFSKVTPEALAKSLLRPIHRKKPPPPEEPQTDPEDAVEEPRSTWTTT